MASRSNPKRSRNIYSRPIIINNENKKVDANLISALWNLIGASSIVTAILFMIGWAYVSNWYSYFGISMDEVNIPPQQILIHSTDALLYYVIFVGIALFFYTFIELSSMLQTLKKEGNPIKKYDFDWRSFLIISLLLGILVAVALIISSPSFGLSDISTINISQIIRFVPSEVVYLLLLIVPIYLRLAYLGYGGIRISKALQTLNIQPYKVSERNMSSFWIVGTIVVAVFVVMSFSAILSIIYASYGIRGMGAGVEKVYLVSQTKESILESVEQVCDTNNSCIYGPFGLIALSDKTIFLAKWETQQEVLFPRGAGLYRLPHNDSYFVIPASYPIPTITPQSSPTIKATPTISQP